MPEIGEQIPDGSRDVVAVLLVLVETLDANPVRVGEHELAHSGDHLADPVPNVPTRSIRQSRVALEDEVGVAHEPNDVRRRRGRLSRVRRTPATFDGIVEAGRELVEKGGLVGGGELWRILDRIRDAAE